MVVGSRQGKVVGVSLDPSPSAQDDTTERMLRTTRWNEGSGFYQNTPNQTVFGQNKSHFYQNIEILYIFGKKEVKIG